MHPSFRQTLAQQNFRANREYDLIPVADLSLEQRALLSGIVDHAETVAVLSPVVDKGLGVKAVAREAADLFRLCTTPGPLPDRIRFSAGHEDFRFVAGLVLDNILQIH